MKVVKVLFVCLGNICRSPMADGVFRDIVDKADIDFKVDIDSAGTSGWHINAPPDERAQRVLESKGIDISGLRSRKVTQNDFNKYDHILAMDQSNLSDLTDISEPEHVNKVRLFLELSDDFGSLDVPDPYYGGEEGFLHVYEMIRSASYGLLQEIKNNM